MICVKTNGNNGCVGKGVITFTNLFRDDRTYCEYLMALLMVGSFPALFRFIGCAGLQSTLFSHVLIIELYLCKSMFKESLWLYIFEIFYADIHCKKLNEN